MKPYRGIIKISCGKEKCIAGMVVDVKPECMGCTEAVSQILDLDDRVLFETRELIKAIKAKSSKLINK